MIAYTFINLEKVTGVLDVGTSFPPYLKSAAPTAWSPICAASPMAAAASRRCWPSANTDSVHAIAGLPTVTSPGPVVFRQNRHGFNHQEFIVFKFRSMRHVAEADGQVAQTSANDARVTATGSSRA